MKKEIISTNDAPAAIGPYSQGVRIDNLLFVSGQIPLDPSTGEVVEGDIQSQSRQALINLKGVIVAAGSSLEKVVKTTVFLINMDDFPKINEAYAEFFTDKPPARACVEVSKLPRDVSIEIEAIAHF